MSADESTDPSGSASQIDGRYPPALREAEEARVAARRKAVREREGRDSWVGVGLSGGGIRSATFCLGLFQALARASLVRKIDFLSTVSGGGYFGGFFGALFSRKAVRGPDQVQEILEEKDERGIVGYLRDNGRYLSPNGSGDLLLAGGVLLRNWVALQIVVLTLVFALVALIRWVGLSATTTGWSFLAWSLHAGAVPWSPWFFVPLAILILWVLPAGWSYWLIGEGSAAWSGVVLVVLLGIGVLAFPFGNEWFTHPAWIGVAAIGLPALTAGFRYRVARRAEGDADSVSGPGNTAKLMERNLASQNLKTGLVWFGVLTVTALVDTLGGWAYAAFWTRAGTFLPTLGSLVTALTGLAGLGGKVAKLFSKDGKRPSVPLNLIATAVAILLVAVILVALSAASHGLVWSWARPAMGGMESLWPAWWLVVALLVAFAFTFLFGRVLSFVNRSTQQPLYGARLTRAYLGASNPERKWGEPLFKVLEGDDVPLGEYWAPSTQEKGAPLHLINVTVNETVDGRTHVQQQDRKGCPLAVGPCGLSLAVNHHLPLDWTTGSIPDTAARPDRKGFHVFEQRPGRFGGETLSLGNWISISGAAFSTGIGYRTSLGLSLLTGLANVRLGYWWRSGEKGVRHPRLLGVVPAQSYIFSEFVARFPGTAWKRWYLSDGGHFENLAGYELIRRRLKRIVIVDAECDPDYQFGGLANLVRKARIDFGTEITFWGERKIGGLVNEEERLPLGTLADLKRKTPEDDSRACAAIADIQYDDGSEGTLLYIKTALCGDVPVDLGEYHAKHPDFPHESTADQFFDDAQWESYRKLGEFNGERLFGTAGNDKVGQKWLVERFFGREASGGGDA